MPIEPYYSEGGITIFCGDAREILPTLGMFDLALCDPPYGIGEANGKPKQRTKPFGSKLKNNTRRTVIVAKDYLNDTWDGQPIDNYTIKLIQHKATHCIIFGGNYYELPPSSCWLVWDKDNSGDFADCELAWTNFNKAVRKFKWRWNGMLQERMGGKKEHRVHPTQKPVALMRWCLSFAPDAKTILDPFAGSCTTGVAAKLEGRQATLIEINERYCEIGANRLRQGVLDFGE